MLALFLLQFVFFNFAEEIGSDRLLPRSIAMTATGTAEAESPSSRFRGPSEHVPDYLAGQKVGRWPRSAVDAVFLAFETIMLFFARVLIVWLYEGAGRSVLIVGIFHASFDATITQALARDHSRHRTRCGSSS